MRRPLALLLLAGLSAFALALCPAAPEKPDLDPAQLRELATHVVTGEVRAIYERTEEEGSWKVTRRVAELAVESVEKGEGIEPGSLVYARYWTRRWTGWGAMPPSTTGHRGLPDEGQRVRVHLARDAYDGFTDANRDGGFNVIGANGFAPPPPAPGKGR
jgi:hypothetical protein